jgi:hypothetical protein
MGSFGYHSLMGIPRRLPGIEGGKPPLPDPLSALLEAQARMQETLTRLAISAELMAKTQTRVSQTIERLAKPHIDDLLRDDRNSRPEAPKAQSGPQT